MKKYIILTILCLYTSYTMQAQISINTNQTSATLNIVSSGNSSATKALKIRNSSNTEIVSLLDNGNLGIQNTNPNVKLDLRSPANENVLAVGNSNLTAAAAKSGAIRYVPSPTDELQYSNGTQWISIIDLPVKALLVVQNSSQQNVSTSTLTDIKNWDIPILDINNNFNRSTGMFTVSRDGIYAVTSTIVFSAGNVLASTHFELQHRILYGGGFDYSVSLIPYTVSNTNVVLANTCKSYHYLKAGATIRVSIYHTTGYTQKISPDKTLNTLTIAEM